MDWELLNKLVDAFMALDVKRLDAETDRYEYKIYWAGTIVRIDVKPKTD